MDTGFRFQTARAPSAASVGNITTRVRLMAGRHFDSFKNFMRIAPAVAQKWMGAAVADIFICPDKNCVWLIKTGGERPLCPFRGCLKHKPKKTTGKKKEAVK